MLVGTIRCKGCCGKGGFTREVTPAGGVKNSSNACKVRMFDVLLLAGF